MNVPSKKRQRRDNAIRKAELPGSFASLNSLREVHEFQRHLRKVRRELAPPMTLAELYYDDFARAQGIQALRSDDPSHTLTRHEAEALYVPFLFIIDLYVSGKLDLEYTLRGDDTIYTYEIIGILRTQDPEDPRWTGPLTQDWEDDTWEHMHPGAEWQTIIDQAFGTLR
jgi:hypothetical protein